MCVFIQLLNEIFSKHTCVHAIVTLYMNITVNFFFTLQMELANKTLDIINIIQTIYGIILKISPPLWKAFSEWHQHVRASLSPCATPEKCSTLTKPSSDSCHSCAKWIEVIELAAESKDALHWDNSNPSRFYDDCVEVTKVFAYCLPNDVTISSFEDFHAVDTLKIMSQFKVFHKEKPELYERIQEVIFVSNEL